MPPHAVSPRFVVPMASVVPSELPTQECVTGTVLVDQYAKDVDTIHAFFRRSPTVVVAGHPYAQVLSHIMDGTWSSVYHVLEDETKEYAALKVIPLGAANAQSYFEEVETLRRFRHPHIVQCYGHFVQRFNDVKCLCIQLEYCSKQSLFEHIQARQRRRNPFSAEKVLAFMNQLVSALKYLHDQGQLHGDVRPKTILVTEDNQLKLSSFGCPLWIERNGRVRRTITGGDRVFAPPEWADSVTLHRRLQPAETPLPSYDMWALGCVLSVLLTLKLLRQERQCTSAMAADPAMHQTILTEVAALHGGLFTPLCTGLLAVDATERLSAAEARHMLRRMTAKSEGNATPRGVRSWFSNLRGASAASA